MQSSCFLFLFHGLSSTTAPSTGCFHPRHGLFSFPVRSFVPQPFHFRSNEFTLDATLYDGRPLGLCTLIMATGLNLNTSSGQITNSLCKSLPLISSSSFLGLRREKPHIVRQMGKETPLIFYCPRTEPRKDTYEMFNTFRGDNLVL